MNKATLRKLLTGAAVCSLLTAGAATYVAFGAPKASNKSKPAAKAADAPPPVKHAGPKDWPMWGRTPDRNMVSPEKNPPTEWDAETGKNILWVAQLGTQSYGNPIVANGIVWLGTNNGARYNPKITADGGVLLGLDAKTGKFLFQDFRGKLPAGRVNDWPEMGMCASPLVENNLLWYATSRCEVVCLDTSPMQAGDPAKEVWKLDMMAELGVFPHNMTSASIAAHKDLIYVITGNGVDDTHKNLPAPEAPSIVCINKKNGEVVWTDNSPGEGVLHGQWSSVALAEIDGKTQVVAPLGDGWVYGYDAETGEILWKFDSNPKESIYPTTRNELIATPVIYKNRMYIANGQDPEHGEGVGLLWCVDITKRGDISETLAAEEIAPARPNEELLVPEGAAKPRKGKPNPNSGVVWKYDKLDVNGDGKIKRVERMNRTIATVCVYNGLVFAPDFSGFFHCLDAETGKHQWTYDMEAAMWGSPMAADGKVYLCDEDGDVAIFEATKDAKKPIVEHNMGQTLDSSPVLSDGVLYIMTRSKLFAVKEGATLKQTAPKDNKKPAATKNGTPAQANEK